MYIYTHTQKKKFSSICVYQCKNVIFFSALSISFSGFKETQLTWQQPTTFYDDAGLPLSGYTTEELPEESGEAWMAEWQVQQRMFSCWPPRSNHVPNGCRNMGGNSRSRTEETKSQTDFIAVRI